MFNIAHFFTSKINSNSLTKGGNFRDNQPYNKIEYDFKINNYHLINNSLSDIRTFYLPEHLTEIILISKYKAI